MADLDVWSTRMRQHDEDCVSHDVDAKSGKVTMTDVGAGANGTCELLLIDGRHLKGSFRAPHGKAMDQSVMDLGNLPADPARR